MPKEWSDKRERQYEHIKDSYEDRGVSEDEAEERAARTVNKERSEAGETKSKKDDRRSAQLPSRPSRMTRALWISMPSSVSAPEPSGPSESV